MKKKTALLLAGLMLTGMCFSTACNGTEEEDGVKIDPLKTQLYVANFDGGVGSEWLDKMSQAFAEMHAETSFEEGKTGVQFILDKSKSDHISAISTEIYNVIFAESVKYNELAASGLILDITDMVRAENEDGKTIESKLSQQQKSALTAVNDKYYALPHFEYYPGITYDKDIFNTKQLYFKQGGGFTNEAGNRSAGPDGKTGTVDDGLPATHEEFFTLCEQMIRVGVAPFIYTGQYPSYLDMLMEGLMASYMGGDELEVYFSFDSTRGGTLSGDDLIKAEIVTGWNGDTPVIEEKVISNETGYLMQSVAGRYYALEFMETIYENKDRYVSNKVKSALGHLDAQEEYIYSSLENKPIAMIIEGSYWYNEAEGAFARSVDAYGEKAEDRNFAWMPLPVEVSGTVTQENGKDFFLVDEANSYAVINANIKDNPDLVALAKAFLQYCYTDSNLQLFTTTENTYKGVQYELTDSQYEASPKYLKSIADVRQDGSNVIRPISDSKIYVNAQSAFLFMHGKVFNSTISGTAYSVPVRAFEAGKTAKEYFEGMRISQESWNTRYSKYFN